MKYLIGVDKMLKIDKEIKQLRGPTDEIPKEIKTTNNNFNEGRNNKVNPNYNNRVMNNNKYGYLNNQQNIIFFLSFNKEDHRDN